MPFTATCTAPFFPLHGSVNSASNQHRRQLKSVSHGKGEGIQKPRQLGISETRENSQQARD